MSKGAFFHHFASKEALAVAAADHWSAVTGALFASAPYRRLADPVERILGYVEFRRSIIKGELAEFTCLVGTMVQETYETSPRIRAACERSILEHARTVEADIAEALRTRALSAKWTPRSLALYMQAVIQGAFLLAKAEHGRAVACDCIDHLLRDLHTLFRVQGRPRKAATAH